MEFATIYTNTAFTDSNRNEKPSYEWKELPEETKEEISFMRVRRSLLFSNTKEQLLSACNYMKNFIRLYPKAKNYKSELN